MRGNIFFIIYLLLVIAQIILNNFLNFSNLFLLSILPTLLVFLSVKRGTVSVMFLAFIIGLTVDFLSDGMLGLTCIALLPVAFLRRGIIGLVMGREVFLRGEELSVRRQGLLKIILLVIIAQSLYFAIYIPVDCAGTVGFGFIALKWFLSIVTSSLVSFATLGLLTDTDRWR